MWVYDFTGASNARMGFDVYYKCECGMRRVDKIEGIVNQRKLWERHYFPTVERVTQ